MYVHRQRCVTSCGILLACMTVLNSCSTEFSKGSRVAAQVWITSAVTRPCSMVVQATRQGIEGTPADAKIKRKILTGVHQGGMAIERARTQRGTPHGMNSEDWFSYKKHA